MDLKKILIMFIIFFSMTGIVFYAFYNYKTITNTVTNIENQELENLISKNNLEYLREYLYKDINLSIKYINTVLNNENVKDYKKYMFNIYKLVVLNKKYIDENFFFEQLKSLKINKKDLPEKEIKEKMIGGIYYHPPLNYVEIYLDYDFSIYHELMHFLDFSFIKDEYPNIYYCDNKINYKRVNDNCEYLGSTYSLALVEAGAEYLNATNFTNYVFTYKRGTRYIALLDYIFGKEKLYELFFSSKDAFFQLLLDNGFSAEQTLSIIRDLDNTLQEISFYDETNFIMDIFIKLYENNIYDKKWYEDEEFLFLLFSAADLRSNIDFSKSKYNELREINNDINNIFDFYQKYMDKINEIDGSNYLINSNENKGELLIIDNKHYIHFFVKNYDILDDITVGYLLINYDFEKDKVIDYKFIESSYILN